MGTDALDGLIVPREPREGRVEFELRCGPTAGRSSASTCDLTISSPERQKETDNGPDHVVPREQFVGVVISFRNDDEPLSG